MNVVACELANDGQQQRVVLVVSRGIIPPHVQRSPIGKQSQHAEWLEENGLFNLARHHHTIDFGALKESNRATNAGEWRFAVRVADFAQFGRGHAHHTDRVNEQPLLARRFRKRDRESSRPRKQAHVTTSYRNDVGVRVVHVSKAVCPL